MMKKIIFIIVLILFFCNIPFYSLASENESNIIYVNDNNTMGPWNGSEIHPYKDIKSAVENASDEDSIIVYSGRYQENTIIINKTLKIIGLTNDPYYTDSGKPFIDAEGFTGFRILDENCVIDGFKIYNARGLYDAVGAVEIRARNATVQNCEIFGKTWYGIDIFSDTIHFINSTLVNNTIKQALTGIRIMFFFDYGHYSNCTIKDNTISQCTDGIRILYGSYTTISGNHIFQNQRGIYCNYGRESTILNNTVEKNNEGGIDVETRGGDIIHNNNISFNNIYALRITTENVVSNKLLISNNKLYSNRCDGAIKISSHDLHNKNFVSEIINNHILTDRGYGINIQNMLNNKIIISENNFLKGNNFLENYESAVFANSFNINWQNNYWKHPRVLPKIIHGKIGLLPIYGGPGLIPCINVDFSPAREQNDIP